jgi:hypothetical protein
MHLSWLFDFDEHRSQVRQSSISFRRWTGLDMSAEGVEDRFRRLGREIPSVSGSVRWPVKSGGHPTSPPLLTSSYIRSLACHWKAVSVPLLHVSRTSDCGIFAIRVT